MRRAAVLLLLAAAAAGALRAADPKPELLVFGAASLTESLQDLGKAYAAKTGRRVAFSFGASSDLALQIQAGAPADVFFSADTFRMDALEKDGLVKAADRREFLSNALIVMVPEDSTKRVSSPWDLLAFRKIALADPAAVPVGVYAKKWLTGLGLWERIGPRLVPTLDVRGSLSALESGGVDAAIVYRTDAAIAKRAKIAYTVADGPSIRYSVAPVATSKHPSEAADLVAFLAGPDGRAGFRRRGFVILSSK